MPSSNICPKCGCDMLEDKHLEALGCHVELVPAQGFLGDKVQVSYCEKCGFVELYHVKKRTW
jgi:predicted nucleic-acid-binding Zn-ribbon protein